MITHDNIYNYTNRAVLLDNNVRLITFLIKDLGIQVTTAAIVERMTSNKNYPSLSKLDLIRMLSSFFIQAIPCKLTRTAAVEYGAGSLMKTDKGQYVYVTHITDRTIEYFHPEKGIRVESIASFERIWQGEVIICNPFHGKYFDEHFTAQDEYECREMAAYRNEVRYIDQFMSFEECKKIICFCEENNLFDRSKVTGATDKETENEFRTSYSAFIDTVSDPLFSSIIERAVTLVNKTTDEIEDLQCVRYREGQEFKFHFDANHHGLTRNFTILVYLNDNYEGGETYFPLINYKVRPKMGAALIFRNTDKDNIPVIYSAHAGLPVHSGEKYALNIWTT